MTSIGVITLLVTFGLIGSLGHWIMVGFSTRGGFYATPYPLLWAILLLSLLQLGGE